MGITNKDQYSSHITRFLSNLKTLKSKKKSDTKIKTLQTQQNFLVPISKDSEELSKEVEILYKELLSIGDYLENKEDAKKSVHYNSREIFQVKKDLEEGRNNLSEMFFQFRYFYHQAEWLLTRFPDGKLQDVEGLVKLVSIEEIRENDYSLTPGRYVGVSAEEEEDYDFKEKLGEIHKELAILDKEANSLSKQIQKNFEELL